MRDIKQKAIAVSMLAIFNVACDSAVQENVSIDTAVIAADPSTEISLTSEGALPANDTAEPADTIHDSPTASQSNENHDSVNADANTTSSQNSPQQDSESAIAPPSEVSQPDNHQDDTNSNNPATATSNDGIADNSTDSASNANQVSSTSYESETTNGGTSASASATAAISLDLSNNTSDSSTTVLSNTDDSYCSEVGDIVDLSISGVLSDTEAGFSTVSLNSYATLDLENHPNVHLVSHSDQSIAVSVTNSDIVDLAVQYESQHDLIYLSAVSPDVAKPFILKKQYPDGSCSFALYTDSGCAVATSDLNRVTASVGETSITAQGCTLGNPENIPVIDLQE